MAKPNLEQQIRRMELIMDTYLDFCQTNDPEVLYPNLQKLKDLKIIDDLRIDRWIIDYEAQRRNDSGIISAIGYDLFRTLFKSQKEEIKFLDINIQLGLSFMNVYNKKIKGLETNFSYPNHDYSLDKTIEYLENLKINEQIFSKIKCISKKEIINDYLKNSLK